MRNKKLYFRHNKFYFYHIEIYLRRNKTIFGFINKVGCLNKLTA